MKEKSENFQMLICEDKDEWRTEDWMTGEMSSRSQKLVQLP